MKFARQVTLPFVFAALAGPAFAVDHSPFSLGKGPYPPVGEEVWRFVDPPVNPSNTRARVVAELREAQRLGLVNAGGESGIKFATPEQERLITLAGQQAIAGQAVAKR